MKTIKLLFPVVALLMVTSCVSVRVVSDYDKEANFNSYKTFAFYKTGIDKANVSDLDKKRILRAIEAELVSRGFVKSENPDLLVNIMTKANKRVSVNNNAYFGFGWGWRPWYWGWGGGGFFPQATVSTRTEGVLFIDLIDTKQKELVWQGIGKGNLTQRPHKKDERIKEFVAEIMKAYPPGADAQP